MKILNTIWFSPANNSLRFFTLCDVYVLKIWRAVTSYDMWCWRFETVTFWNFYVCTVMVLRYVTFTLWNSYVTELSRYTMLRLRFVAVSSRSVSRLVFAVLVKGRVQWEQRGVRKIANVIGRGLGPWRSTNGEGDWNGEGDLNGERERPIKLGETEIER